MKHKNILIILLALIFNNSTFSSDYDIKLLLSKCDCKEIEGRGFDNKGRVIKQLGGGDYFESLYHVCN